MSERGKPTSTRREFLRLSATLGVGVIFSACGVPTDGRLPSEQPTPTSKPQIPLETTGTIPPEGATIPCGDATSHINYFDTSYGFRREQYATGNGDRLTVINNEYVCVTAGSIQANLQPVSPDGIAECGTMIVQVPSDFSGQIIRQNGTNELRVYGQEYVCTSS